MAGYVCGRKSETLYREMDEGIKVREVGRLSVPSIRLLSFKYWRVIEDI